MANSLIAYPKSRAKPMSVWLMWRMPSVAMSLKGTRAPNLVAGDTNGKRDIFLRELISNGADACEKLRYEALAKPELTEGGAPFAITLEIDKDAGTLALAHYLENYRPKWKAKP